jgi:hypothetical protein
MALKGIFIGSRSITITATFAAMIAILDSIPIIPGFYSGIWDSWAFMLSPIVGILLGPALGAFAVGLGGLVGHLVYFRDPTELVFMLGAPVGAGIAGLVYERKWYLALGIYSLLLVSYFITPVSWLLSLWGIWDVLVGYALILGAAIVSKFNGLAIRIEQSTTTKLILSAVIGLEADILTRIFILIPLQTYWFFYGFSAEELQVLWLGAGFITPIKVVLAAIAAIAICRPLIGQFQGSKNESIADSVKSQ